MSAETRLAELLETEFIPTGALVTIGAIKAALPADAYGLVLATFVGAKVPQAGTLEAIAAAGEMESSFIAMSGGGLSLSSPERQATVDALAIAGQWPAAVRDAVKALGGVMRPKWVGAGYASEPTLEIVTAEIETKRTAIHRAAILAAIKHASNFALDEIESVETLPTIPELIALIESRITTNWPEA